MLTVAGIRAGSASAAPWASRGYCRLGRARSVQEDCDPVPGCCGHRPADRVFSCSAPPAQDLQRAESFTLAVRDPVGPEACCGFFGGIQCEESDGVVGFCCPQEAQQCSLADYGEVADQRRGRGSVAWRGVRGGGRGIEAGDAPSGCAVRSSTGSVSFVICAGSPLVACGHAASTRPRAPPVLVGCRVDRRGCSFLTSDNDKFHLMVRMRFSVMVFGTSDITTSADIELLCRT